MDFLIHGAYIGCIAGAVALLGRLFKQSLTASARHMAEAMRQNTENTDTEQLTALASRITVLETEREAFKRELARLEDDCLRYLKKGTQALRRAKEREGLEDIEGEPEPTQDQLELVTQMETGEQTPANGQTTTQALSLDEIRAIALRG